MITYKTFFKNTQKGIKELTIQTTDFKDELFKVSIFSGLNKEENYNLVSNFYFKGKEKVDYIVNDIVNKVRNSAFNKKQISYLFKEEELQNLKYPLYIQEYTPEHKAYFIDGILYDNEGSIVSNEGLNKKALEIYNNALSMNFEATIINNNLLVSDLMVENVEFKNRNEIMLNTLGLEIDLPFKIENEQQLIAASHSLGFDKAVVKSHDALYVKNEHATKTYIVKVQKTKLDLDVKFVKKKEQIQEKLENLLVNV